MGTKGHLFAAAISLATTAAASAQFWSVGTLPGFGNSAVNDLSSDGGVALGTISGSGPIQTAFLWTRESGRDELRNDPSVPMYSLGYGLSGDGRVAVGIVSESRPNGPVSRAYRWSGPGTFQILGDPGPNTGSVAVDANRDGSVIVGNLTVRGIPAMPFRWTQEGGMQALGYALGSDTTAQAISDDGNKIVGFISSVGRGFVWTAGNGYELVSGLPGGDGLSGLLGMNRAGTIYVGWANIEATGAMWINNSVINLGKLDGNRGFNANCVDDLGTVVAGTSDRSGATVWTQTRGLELLSDYLVSQGVTLPMNLILSSCESVSADGRTFGGLAYTPTDGLFGYVVMVPAPSTLVFAASACIFSIRRRRDV